MGLPWLSQLLKKNGIVPIRGKISAIKGKVIGVDLSNLLYKLLYFAQKAYKSQGEYLIDLMNFALRLKNEGVIPVFVADGKPPEEKKELISARNKTRAVIQERIKKLSDELFSQGKNRFTVEYIRAVFSGDISDDFTNGLTQEQTDKIIKLKNLSTQSIFITEDIKKQSIELLLGLGMPVYYNENLEADYILGKLYKAGIIKSVLSEDRDMFIFGFKSVITKFNIYTGLIEVYKIEPILEKLKFTPKQFIDFCILSGTDYGKQRGIGAKIAYALISKYITIEESISKEIKKKKNYDPLWDYSRIRKIFDGTLFECPLTNINYVDGVMKCLPINFHRVLDNFNSALETSITMDDVINYTEK